jgi:hypothetical protein
MGVLAAARSNLDSLNGTRVEFTRLPAYSGCASRFFTRHRKADDGGSFIDPGLDGIRRREPSA